MELGLRLRIGLEGMEMSLEDTGREELGLGLRLVLGGARAKARGCRSWG